MRAWMTCLTLQVVETTWRYDDACIPGATTQDREAFLYQVVCHTIFSGALVPVLSFQRSCSWPLDTLV